MLGTIKLNIIKNVINDFELRSCVYIAPHELRNSIAPSGSRTSFSPLYYNSNNVPFYIICSNKRRGSYDRTIFNNFNIGSRNSRNEFLDACDIDDKNLMDIYNLKLDRFLIMQKNDDFLGWHPANKLLDKCIITLKGNKYCRHVNDKIYYGNNTYNVDTDKLHLFVRLIPKESIDLTNLIINCDRDAVYNISDRSDFDKVGTLGFIVKLDNRYKYVYSKVFKKVSRIKYPFLNKNVIDNAIFDGFQADYQIAKEIIYIKDNSKLDKYGIKVLDNF